MHISASVRARGSVYLVASHASCNLAYLHALVWKLHLLSELSRQEEGKGSKFMQLVIGLKTFAGPELAGQKE